MNGVKEMIRRIEAMETRLDEDGSAPGQSLKEIIEYILYLFGMRG